MMRQRLAMAAVLASSLAVAACQQSTKGADTKPQNNAVTGSSAPSSEASSPQAPTGPAFKAGSVLISDGTDTVTVDGTPVKFPTTVTDAVFSPDGSKLVFVDGDGNISTARPDGTQRVALTKKDSNVKRSHPAWYGATVLYTEKDASGATHMKMWGVAPTAGAPIGVVVADFSRGGSPSDLVGDGDPTNVGGILAYQHKSAKSSEVYIVDHSERSGDESRLIGPGSQPAVSPDGKTLAFVGTNGGIDVMAAGWSQTKVTPKQILAPGKSPAHLTWTPDSKDIVFSTASDIEQVPATGGGTSQVSATPGVATLLPAAIDQIEHITGDGLVGTAIVASQQRFGTQTQTRPPAGGGYWPTAVNVVLGSADDTRLAFVGAKQAESELGPLLFTPKDTLDPRVAAEIKRALGTEPASNNPPDPTTGDYQMDTVYIMGDTSVVSANVEAAVKALGYHVKRIAGTDPVAVTAAAMKPFTPDAAGDLTLVSANDPAALATMLSRGEIGDVLLTNGSSMPDADKAVLNSVTPNVTVVAVGPGAAAAAASSWTGKPSKLSVKKVAAGTAPDYLTGAVVVAPTGSKQDAMMAGIVSTYFNEAQIVFVDPASGIDPTVANGLAGRSQQVNTVAVLDSGSVLKDIDAKIGALVAGPLGPQVVTNPKAPDATQ